MSYVQCRVCRCMGVNCDKYEVFWYLAMLAHSTRTCQRGCGGREACFSACGEGDPNRGVGLRVSRVRWEE